MAKKCICAQWVDDDDPKPAVEEGSPEATEWTDFSAWRERHGHGHFNRWLRSLPMPLASAEQK